MTHPDLATWDGVETAARIAAGDVTMESVVAAATERARAAADLDAIVTQTFDRARRFIPQRGPLFGVPTFIKDLARLEGVRTRWGSRSACRTGGLSCSTATAVC